MKKNLIVGQSGGPTAVINSSLYGVVSEAYRQENVDNVIGMVNGIHALIPSAKVGHIGLYRDPETHEPHEYYCKLPDSIDQREVYVLDPMLATGGSAEAAITFIKQHGCTNIKFLCIIAAPTGIERLHTAHPDVHIYCGHVDEGLNENCYIVPGLGDAGDRIFGTK